MDYRIRNEQPADYRIVEDLTREAFWNVHVPGCDEHYLVHVMRSHPDFVPELDFVLETDGKLIANIMYTRAKLTGKSGAGKDILTFGPVSVLPAYQRQGYGSKLIRHSFSRAVELGYEAVVIFGNPGNYVGLGFRSCSRYGVSIGNDEFPSAMLVKELREGVLGGTQWTYVESEVFSFDREKSKQFDLGFPAQEKAVTAGQEEFFILSHSRITGTSSGAA